jgi:signal peptidase II
MNRPLSKWRLFVALVVAGLAADQATKLLAVGRLTHAFAEARAHGLPAQVVAFYTVKHPQPGAPYPVFRPWWQMAYAENPGAAWSLFRDRSESFRNGFFGLVTLAAAAFILWYARRVGERQRWLQVALAFVLAGALGNAVDRAVRSYVVDFIDWYCAAPVCLRATAWWDAHVWSIFHAIDAVHWPTFNVADSLISVGVVMLLLHPGAEKRPA